MGGGGGEGGEDTLHISSYTRRLLVPLCLLLPYTQGTFAERGLGANIQY